LKSSPEGLESLVREIDAQAARAKFSMKPYGPLLLPPWLIFNGAVVFKLMSTEDVVWIAPYTVTRSRYGFKTGQHQQINVADRFGSRRPRRNCSAVLPWPARKLGLILYVSGLV
jgi:hypothetical protein